MTKITSYKQLIVWQKAMDLCVDLYKITEQYPKSEIYGLVSQSRRSGVGIPSNIAEGYMRGHKAEYIQFLRIAFGAGAELETHFLLAFKIGYLGESDFEKLNSQLQEIMMMLSKLIQKLSMS